MPANEARRRPKPRTLVLAGLAAIVAVAALPAAWSAGANAPSPGNFSGYGFDACQAPTTGTMDAWMGDPGNPYRAVGIYISGSLRGCSQPNLSSAWLSHVQSTGWHAIPIHVGPQAYALNSSGQPRWSRMVNPDPTSIYLAARMQGAAEADVAVNAASSMGIPPSSTLFYDMEGWNTGDSNVDASAMWFLSAWSNRLHARGYASGLYSSSGSGIALMNQTANNRPPGFVLPDQMWSAWWYYQPCPDPTSTASMPGLSAGAWNQHQRIWQYCGGHDTTNGGVTLNIDSNLLDVQTVSVPAPVPDPGNFPVTSTPRSLHTTPVTGAGQTVTPVPPAASVVATSASPAPAAKPTTPTAAAPPVVTQDRVAPTAPPGPAAPAAGTAHSAGIQAPNGPIAPPVPPGQHQPLTLVPSKAAAPKPAEPKPAAPKPVAAKPAVPALPAPVPVAPSPVTPVATDLAQAAPVQPTNDYALPKASQQTFTDDAMGVFSTVGRTVVNVATPVMGWFSRMVESLFN